MNYDVFISYSRKDTAIADKICAALDQQGISYFIDRKGIGGGMEFPAVIADAILNSKIMLFLGSENSYQSKFTNSEVTFAFNEKPMGTIIPYIIDGSKLPPALKFTFSSINLRTINEHPIETTLIQDLCQILGRKYVDKEKKRQQEELKRLEEQRQKEEKKRCLKEEARHAEEERLRKEAEERQKEEKRLKDEEERKAAEERKKRFRDKVNGYSDYLIILLPLLFLGIGIWVGMEYQSLWLGTEIFLAFGWLSVFASLGLSYWAENKLTDMHNHIAAGLLAIVIAIGIHSGIYLSSWWKGTVIGVLLFSVDFLYFYHFLDDETNVNNHEEKNSDK